jgi:hypothetical protein
MVTMGGDLQSGCLADRLLTGLGQPQINPLAQRLKEVWVCWITWTGRMPKNYIAHNSLSSWGLQDIKMFWWQLNDELTITSCCTHKSCLCLCEAEDDASVQNEQHVIFHCTRHVVTLRRRLASLFSETRVQDVFAFLHQNNNKLHFFLHELVTPNCWQWRFVWFG